MPPPSQQRPGEPQPSGGAWRLWLLFAGLALVLFYLNGGAQVDERGDEIAYSQFFAFIEEGAVEKVTLQGENIRGVLTKPHEVDGRQVKEFRTLSPNYIDLEFLQKLREKNVKVVVEPAGPSPMVQLAIQFLPYLLLIGMLNGLLPCGLVYLAVAGAMATGSVAEGMTYMALFGLGTIPLMLTTAMAGQFIDLRCANGCLNGNIEVLTRNEIFKFFTHSSTKIIGISPVNKRA